MSVRRQRECDQMYIYKYIYIYIYIYKSTRAMPQAPCHSAETQNSKPKKHSNEACRFLFKVQFKKTHSEHLVYHGISRWAGARPNVYIQIDLCMLECLSVDSTSATKCIYTNRPMYAMMSVRWQRERVQMYIYKSTCTRSQAPCHSAEAQNSKQKKTVKNMTISF